MIHSSFEEVFDYYRMWGNRLALVGKRGAMVMLTVCMHDLYTPDKWHLTQHKLKVANY